MPLQEFRNILKFLGGGEPTPEERKQLFKEVALMTLARATAADTNIKAVEVDTVQRILQEVTGEPVSIADIEVAARSDLFEKKPLDRYLAGVGKKLDAVDRVTLLGSLAEVVRSDERISPFEIAYFDMVGDALKATPSEIAGLVAADAEPIAGRST